MKGQVTTGEEFEVWSEQEKSVRTTAATTLRVKSQQSLNWEELKFECESQPSSHFVVWEAPAGSQSWDAFFQAYTWTEHLEELKRIAEDDFMKKFEEKGVCVCGLCHIC